MLYDLRNEYDIASFREHCKNLLEAGNVVEIKKVYPKRSKSQNSYLHVILGYFACETGYTLEEAKLLIFKKQCNRELFERKKTNKRGVEITTYRSSSDLTTAEMTTAIERFRNYSANGGIYLPAPNEEQHLLFIRKEIERNKDFV